MKLCKVNTFLVANAAFLSGYGGKANSFGKQAGADGANGAN